jgi:hypothetical protein
MSETISVTVVSPTTFTPDTVETIDIHAATTKTAIVNADEVGGADSEHGFSLVRNTWTAIKAFLKTYFDTLYQAVLVSGTNIKTINSTSLLGSGDITITVPDPTITTSTETTITGILAGDGANIKVAVVGTDYMPAYSLNNFTDWATGTSYSIGDGVVDVVHPDLFFYYLCKEDHVSGSTFNDDYISGRWNYVVAFDARLSEISDAGVIKYDGAGVISVAVPGTDYMYAYDLNNATTWTESTEYILNDVVTNTAEGYGRYYVCKTAHTSSGSFSADVANWLYVMLTDARLSDVEGIVLASGGSLSAAVAGADYLAPFTAGTIEPGTAPIKLIAGPLNTLPEAGAIEFDGTNLYFTDSTNTRHTIAVVA